MLAYRDKGRDSGILAPRLDTRRRWGRARGVDESELLAFVHGRRTTEVVGRFAPAIDPLEEATRFEAGLAGSLGPDSRIDAVCGFYAALAPGRRAVVTSATRAGARARLDGLGLEVGVLVAAEDVERGKPSGEGYVAAAAQLGVAPESCVVFEDSPIGVAAGRAARATVVAVDTTHPAAELERADHVVTTRELLGLAERLLG